MELTDKELICSSYQKACDELNLKLQYKNTSDQLIVIRLFSELSKLLGNDIELMRDWMKTYNQRLMFVPEQVINRKESLYQVVSYLESVCH